MGLFLVLIIYCLLEEEQVFLHFSKKLGLNWFYCTGSGNLFGCVCKRHVSSAEGKKVKMFYLLLK